MRHFAIGAVLFAAIAAHAGDEMVEDEVVQDDEPGRPTKCVEDPVVRLGVVADVVDGKIRAAWWALCPALHDAHVETLAECRQEERGVVGDPGGFRRHR